MTATATRKANKAMLEAYTGLELARLSAELVRAMADSPAIDDSEANYCHCDDGEISAIEMACKALEEHAYADRLLVADRVFVTIRDYANRWPLNEGGSEAALLALALAERFLDRASSAFGELPDEHSLYWATVGAWHIVSYQRNLIECSLAGIDHDEVLDDILAGRPLPEFATAEDVTRSKIAWAKFCKS